MKAVLTCVKCGSSRPRIGWPKFGDGLHLKPWCSACESAIVAHRQEVALAKAEGFISLAHKLARAPEVKRREREAWRAKRGIVVKARPAPHSARMARADRRADVLRAKFFRAMTSEFLQLWMKHHRQEFLEQVSECTRMKYWSDPDAARHRKKIWKAGNPERIAKFTGKRGTRMMATDDCSLRPQSLQALFDRAISCTYCETPFKSDAEKSLDHFVPLALGGRHSIANAVVCCRTCNFSKGKTHPLHWLGEAVFESILQRLRSRCSGEPCSMEVLYPEARKSA